MRVSFFQTKNIEKGIYLLKYNLAIFLIMIFCLGESMSLLSQSRYHVTDSLSKNQAEQEKTQSKQTTASVSTSPVVNNLLNADDCEKMSNYEFYPIALHQSTLVGVNPGTQLGDIFNGAGYGNFGWLSWTGKNDAPTLAASLTIPGNSQTYKNPYHTNDYLVSVGDWVYGAPGVKNAIFIRTALDVLVNYPIAVPIWSEAQETGSNLKYHVIGFALVTITSYKLAPKEKISAIFLGMVENISEWQSPLFNKRYTTRSQGANGFSENITVPAAGNYTLTVKNSPDLSKRVNWAIVTLNGQTIVIQADFGPAVEIIKKTVQLNVNNQMQLQLNGTPDSWLILTISIPCEVENRPPKIISTPVSEGREGVLYSYDVEAIDPDQDILTYALSEFPDGMVIDPQSGLISWTPSGIQTGSHAVTVKVEDGRGGSDSQSYTIVVVEAINNPPRIISTPVIVGREGELYTYDVEAVDPDQDPVIYSLIKSPAGMSIDAQTGLISWTPSIAQVGDHEVTVDAADPQGLNDIQIFPVYVGGTSMDLEPKNLDVSQVAINSQTLKMTGLITLKIFNNGNEAVEHSYKLALFEDINRNSQYDPNVDHLLSERLFNTGPLPGKPMDVTIAVNSLALYVGTVIHAYVDINQEIAESNEVNNYTNSIADCNSTPPPPGQFNPVLKWEWTGSVNKPKSNEPYASPIVANLTDDNMDGKIDDKDIPDIIFATYEFGKWPKCDTIRAISGDDGREIFSFTGYFINAGDTPAIGDIDADGLPEIIFPIEHENSQDAPGTARILALKNNGVVKWISPTYAFDPWSLSVALADLEGDGRVEIVVGRLVLNNDGTLKWKGSSTESANHSIIADINLDGKQEVIDGGAAYSSSGNLIWSHPQIKKGMAAVANFDNDPYPEIVVVSSGYVYLFEHTGEIKWGPIDIPPSGITNDRGGSPTIADLDGDGLPEIGVAGGYNYVVFESDGSVKWAVKTQDLSSNCTGSTVFDFEGDGKSEVLYADEMDFFIFRGDDGKILFKKAMGGGTAFEYPVVVDVNNDNKAEILVISNSYFGHPVKPPPGIHVFGDAKGTWVNTRKIWNQHAYCITNVNDDGTIPQYPANNWQIYNNFRCNYSPDALACVDVAACYIRLKNPVNSANKEILTRIGNAGRLAIAKGLPVAFFDGDPRNGGTLLGVTSTDSKLEVCQYLEISLSVSQNLTGMHNIYIWADNDGTGKGLHYERDEENNIASAPFNFSNLPPVITSTPILQASENRTYFYNVEAVDMDGDPITFSLLLAPAGMTIDETSGQIAWAPQNSKLGNNNVIVEARDSQNGAAAQSFTINVLSFFNNPPLIQSQPKTTATKQVIYAYQVLAADPENDSLFYQLEAAPPGMIIDPFFGWILWLPTAADLGPHSVTVKVLDSFNAFVTQSFIVEVSEFVNHDPVIKSQPPLQGKEGEIYKYQVQATDDDNDPLTYKLTQFPDGMKIDSGNGLITWTPSGRQAGDHWVTVQVSDILGGKAVQTFIIQVAEAINMPPDIVSKPEYYGKVGRFYQYDVNALDADNDQLGYYLLQMPAGMTINESNGMIEWTPAAGQDGVHTIIIEVRDNRGGLAQQTYTLIVADFANEDPLISSLPVISGSEGVLYTYPVEAVDANNDELTYHLVIFPSGMQIDEHTGIIEWLPDSAQSGAHAVKIKVTDPKGGFAEQEYTLTIAEAWNCVPVIVSRPLTMALKDAIYSYDVEATDADLDTLTYVLIGAVDRMTIDSATGRIDWQPVADDLGQHLVIVEVADGRGGVAQQSYTLYVNAGLNHDPEIISQPVQKAVAGQSYQYSLLARDVDNDPLVFTLMTWPDGMAIQSSGLINWIPEKTQLGLYEVKVEVADGHGGFAQQSYQIEVKEPGPVEDSIRPEVRITALPSSIMVGKTVVLTVSASDNVGVTSVRATVNGTPVELNSENKGYFISTRQGVFTAQAYALDAADNEGIASVEFKVLSGSSGSAPTVSITAPTDFGKLLTPTDIIGTVTDADNDLLRYTLSYSPKDKNIYTVFVRGTTPVANGVLGKLDTTALDNGLYDIRLRAEDATGRIDYFDMVVEVSGRMKLGNFSLSFKDLEIPMAGIPISIIRTYDSRKRVEHGDFGFGWQLSFANEMKLEVSCSLAENWYEYYEPGGMNRLPKFWIEETKEHFVTITYPDGRVDKFRMKMTPMADITKIRFLNYSFTPEPGTFSSLRALGCPPRLYTMEELGPFTLVDEDSYDEFAPQRYELSTAEGYKYVINKNSGVESITDNNGNKITITADGIIHSGGKSVTFVRGSASRINVIKDPDGNEIKYDYDYYGDLVSVTDALGNKVRFIYNSEHYLTDIIDPRGFKVARNEYDDSGRLVANIDAEGNRIVYTHDIAGREEIVTDRLGNQTRFIYDNRGNVLAKTDALGNTWDYTYDANDNKLYEKDPLNNTSNYTYDGKNNLLTQADPLGHTTTYTYNAKNQALTITDAQDNVTSNEYDAKGNLIKSKDALNHETVYTYDAAGNLKTAMDPAGNVVTNNYDPAANLLSITNPLNSSTTFTYDSRGNQLTQTINRTLALGGTETVTSTNVYSKTSQVIQTIDPNGFATVTEYNSLGKQSATIDKLGRRTEYEYDIRGNLVKTKFPDNTEATAQYDAEGRRIASKERDGSSTAYTYNKTGQLIKTTYADGFYTQTMYDNAGRVYQNIDERGNATTYEYDAAGRKTAFIDALGHSTAFAYDENGNLIMMTDAKNQVFRYEYDALNRKTRTIFPDNSFTLVTYDNLGRKVSEIDQAGKNTAYNYDALGRLVKVTNALNQDTRYNYDELGSLIAQTDAQNRITTFAYDKLGRRTRRTLPLGMSETMQYNALGNVINRTDFNGNTITFEYNPNNQLTRKNLPNGQAEVYVYNNGGQMQSVSDSRGTVTYQYDVRGRMLRRIDPDGAQIAYGYDEAGNRTSVTIPSATIAYTYDNLNRLQSVSAPYGGAAYSYDNVGNRESVSYANGTVSEYVYNSLNRLVFLKNRKNNGDVISSYQYFLGPAGNRTQVIEHTGRIVDYSYDNTYKLLEESISDPITGNRVIGYIYDAVGNRQTKMDNGQLTQYAYDANDRLLTENAAIYSYDNNGNTLRKQSPLENLTYSYDYQNRMTASVLINNAGVTNLAYKYDPFGIRVEKTTNGQTIKYLVDHNMPYAQVLEERNAIGNLQASYVYGDDLISQNRLTGTSYYHYDGLGSTRALTDPSANITDTYNYEAFGTFLNKSGTTPNDYLFTGEQYDPNLGFYYLRARYYNPEIGRFATMDTIEGNRFDPKTLHKYQYCLANPVNYIDPSGKFSLSEEIAITSIIGVLFGHISWLHYGENSVISHVKFLLGGALLVTGLELGWMYLYSLPAVSRTSSSNW